MAVEPETSSNRIHDQIEKAPLRTRHIDLNEAVNDVIALARREIIKDGISVQIRPSEGLLPVQAIVFNCNKSFST